MNCAKLCFWQADVVATDHAPHTLAEKKGGASCTASGGPLVTAPLQMISVSFLSGIFTKVARCRENVSRPATLRLKERGFYSAKDIFADLVL